MREDMYYTTKCSTEDKNGAGIWQWVIATEDNEILSFTSHIVCRTGDLHNQEPLCPYYACLNADCSQCNENWEQEAIDEE